MEIGGSKTFRVANFNLDVINIYIVRIAARSVRTIEDGVDDLSVHTVGKREFILFPSGSGGILSVEVQNFHKSAEVVGVGHVTSFHAAVAGRGLVQPEAHKEGFRVVGQIQALSADGGVAGRVTVEIKGTVAGVRIAGGDVRISRIGTGGDSCFPTIGDETSTGTHVVEVHAVRQFGLGYTDGVEAAHVVRTGSRRTYSSEPNGVFSVGSQIKNFVCRVAQLKRRFVIESAACGNDGQLIAAVFFVISPRNHSRVSGHIADSQ